MEFIKSDASGSIDSLSPLLIRNCRTTVNAYSTRAIDHLQKIILLCVHVWWYLVPVIWSSWKTPEAIPIPPTADPQRESWEGFESFTRNFCWTVCSRWQTKQDINRIEWDASIIHSPCSWISEFFVTSNQKGKRHQVGKICSSFDVSLQKRDECLSFRDGAHFFLPKQNRILCRCLNKIFDKHEPFFVTTTLQTRNRPISKKDTIEQWRVFSSQDETELYYTETCEPQIKTSRWLFECPLESTSA